MGYCNKSGSEGCLYKYEILPTKSGETLKADPFAFYSELRPNTASIVYSLKDYEWGDNRWLREKKKGTSYLSRQ